MREPVIRPLKLRQDLVRVLSFQCDLYELNFPDFECSPRFLIEQEQRIREAYAEPGRQGLFVLEVAGWVEGFLWLVLRPGRKGQVWGYVDQIYLTPEHRSKGYGFRLMRFAEVWFRKNGAAKSKLQVTAANLTAVRLYTGLGYEIARYEMEKDL